MIAVGFDAFLCGENAISVDSEGNERGSITGEVVVLGLETVGTHSVSWPPAARNYVSSWLVEQKKLERKIDFSCSDIHTKYSHNLLVSKGHNPILKQWILKNIWPKISKIIFKFQDIMDIYLKVEYSKLTLDLGNNIL